MNTGFIKYGTRKIPRETEIPPKGLINLTDTGISASYNQLMAMFNAGIQPYIVWEDDGVSRIIKFSAFSSTQATFSPETTTGSDWYFDAPDGDLDAPMVAD